jgi:hypothetical protein
MQETAIVETITDEAAKEKTFSEMPTTEDVPCTVLIPTVRYLHNFANPDVI